MGKVIQIADDDASIVSRVPTHDFGLNQTEKELSPQDKVIADTIRIETKPATHTKHVTYLQLSYVHFVCRKLVILSHMVLN